MEPATDSNGLCQSWIMRTWSETFRRMVAQASRLRLLGRWERPQARRLRHHGIRALALGGIVQLLCFSAFAGDDGLLLYYPCDEKSGTVLHDAGPYHKDGALNAVVN